MLVYKRDEITSVFSQPSFLYIRSRKYSTHRLIYTCHVRCMKHPGHVLLLHPRNPFSISLKVLSLSSRNLFRVPESFVLRDTLTCLVYGYSGRDYFKEFNPFNTHIKLTLPFFFVLVIMFPLFTLFSFPLRVLLVPTKHSLHTFSVPDTTSPPLSSYDVRPLLLGL